MSGYPDFFIIGAPKCGTTALAAYLEQSDMISFHRKEIHYFGSDLNFQRPRVSLKEYLRKSMELAEHGLVGDASVYYLRSTEAASEIKSANPDAKIIICLRNPVDFMVSLHAQLLSNADEVERDFGKALDLEVERRRGVGVPWHTHPVHALFYREMARFSEQVKRYMDIFGRDKVKVVLLEELSLNSDFVVRDVMEFLGVEAPSVMHFNVVNSTTDIRFLPLKIIHKTLLSADGRLRRIIPRIVLRPVDFVFFKLMSKPATKKSIEPELRLMLNDEFLRDVKELEKIISRDLGLWIEEMTSSK